MTKMKESFPADVDYATTLDTTDAVRAGMEEIVMTLVIAFVLVILVVYVFLQDWRATLIPMLAVPVSLVGTFLAFPLFGFSINTLSLFGLVLAIGLVVDDAIVVVEGIQRHIEEGMAPKDAAPAAMDELAGPVVGIALVRSAVFVPTVFIPGITGRLYQQFALTIAISVIVSAFNALTLSPALGWPNVARLDEPSDIGRALSCEEEGRLLGAAQANRSPYIYRFIKIGLLAGMRSGEIRTLQLERLDLENRELRVGRSKTASGRGRGIPMNPELFATISEQVEFLKRIFGKLQPCWYLFPFCEGVAPTDPTRPVTTVKSAWESVRTAAGINCRLHDLRHTAATKMAENDVPEGTMKALLGHMSQKMIERYSHIRNAAKRKAVDGLTLAKPIIAIPKDSPKVTVKMGSASAGK